MNKGTLFLIPSLLGESNINRSVPDYNLSIIRNLKHFIVEDIRSARRFLKQCDKNINIENITFYTLNKHTDFSEINNFLLEIQKGFDVGIISEAGCPAIADPGSEIVKLAHQKEIQVVALVGPSSILLSLMGSGMNGQNFTFHGYLPKEQDELVKKLKQIEQDALSKNQTQIFIETPFRNDKLFNAICNTCNELTTLCVASNLTLSSEKIVRKSIKEWKKSNGTLNKIPSIFLLGR